MDGWPRFWILTFAVSETCVQVVKLYTKKREAGLPGRRVSVTRLRRPQRPAFEHRGLSTRILLKTVPPNTLGQY